MIKKILAIMIMLTSVIVCKAQSDDPTTWKYFSIIVKESDDILFNNLSKELYLGLEYKDEFDIEYERGRYGDYMLGGMYQIVVNLTDEQPQNQYVVVGDISKNLEKDRRASRYAWSQLSSKTQKGLLNWNKTNKINLDRLPIIDEDANNPRTWKYFRILARADDDIVFVNLQDDMHIYPILESYSIVVNLISENPKDHFIVLGDENDPNSLRYTWSQISREVQNGLINWSNTNKENLNDAVDYKSKVDLYTELINANPKYSRLYYIYYLRGKAETKVGSYEGAVSDYDMALKLKPDFTNVFIKRGYAYLSLEEYRKAIDDFNNAIKYNPDNLKLYGYRGEAYYYSKQFKKAIKDFQYVIKTDPSFYMVELYKWYIKDAEKNK